MIKEISSPKSKLLWENPPRGGYKMARADSILLDKGDKFPEMEMNLVSGETVRLPEATGQGYGVVLFYRGYW
jgi:hypothetical protein